MKRKKVVALPGQISLLVEALNCQNEDSIRLLVHRAMKVSFEENHSFSSTEWDEKDLNAVVDLIRGINPKDTTEAILAAQFVALNLQGLAIVAENNFNIFGQGMMLIRLSHQALDMLQKYRGKNQTLNAHYNVHSEGNAVLNTMIKTESQEKKEHKT